MNINKIILVFLFMSIGINAQQVAIAGGGSVMDWANLKKYQKSLPAYRIYPATQIPLIL